jgi:hypothetical protein
MNTSLEIAMRGIREEIEGPLRAEIERLRAALAAARTILSTGKGWEIGDGTIMLHVHKKGLRDFFRARS